MHYIIRSIFRDEVVSLIQSGGLYKRFIESGDDPEEVIEKLYDDAKNKYDFERPTNDQCMTSDDMIEWISEIYDFHIFYGIALNHFLEYDERDLFEVCMYLHKSGKANDYILPLRDLIRDEVISMQMVYDFLRENYRKLLTSYEFELFADQSYDLIVFALRTVVSLEVFEQSNLTRKDVYEAKYHGKHKPIHSWYQFKDPKWDVVKNYRIYFIENLEKLLELQKILELEKLQSKKSFTFF